MAPTYKPEAMVGIGGGPTRATTLPTEGSERKKYPIASGVLDYFPDAIAAVSRLSWQGNEQHNPGEPLHWARHKSTDEADTLMRHFLQRGTVDTDGIPHSVKVAWRSLALLQREIENGLPGMRKASNTTCVSRGNTSQVLQSKVRKTRPTPSVSRTNRDKAPQRSTRVGAR